jgi:thiosulfate/3-mercaptopyruvate sulfurtransferase
VKQQIGSRTIMANSPLKSSDWLEKNLGRNGLIILDASWHLPNSDRNAEAEFTAAHIPGARRFDINAISDSAAEQPHTLPNAADFGASVAALGVSNSSKIIIYDNSDFRTAARAWWMFRIMGHKNVYVLNGGFQKWKAQKRSVEKGAANIKPGFYTARYNPALYFTKDDVLQNIESEGRQMLDARSPGRFMGVADEPRPGLRSGHIPGAHNLPFADLYALDGTLMTNQGLTSTLLDAGIDPKAPIAVSCGSGITACCIALALAQLGHWSTPIYDGSWSEWGGDPALPIET